MTRVRGKCLLIAVALSVLVADLHAQPNADGRWEGTLKAGPASLRLVVDIRRTADGIFLGTLTSVDQGNVAIPIDLIQVNGASVRMEVRAVRGTFEGTFSDDGSRITGTWSQGAPLPLELKRVTAPVEAERAAEAAKTSESVTSATTGPNPFGIPLDLEVPVPPMPSVGNGQTHLVYEMHMTNFGPFEVGLRRIDVLSGDQTIGSVEGGELNSALLPVGAPPAGAATPGSGPSDFRSIESGRRAVAWLWITLDKGAAIPTQLRHRITAGEQTVEGAPVVVGSAGPVTIGAPLRGGLWLAGNGPANASIHRRALLPVAGRARIAQRFAIDWVKIDMKGRAFDGDSKDNKAYFAHGEEALAVADGVVIAIKDGIPENVPGLTSRAVPITLETVGGNFVTLDLGSGRYAFYAHFQPGSLRVKPGDRVRRGQVLGLVGNSGNSTQAHLHFHVSDSAESLGSEGVPYVLDAFEVFSQAGTSESRQSELPMQNAVVRFP